MSDLRTYLYDTHQTDLYSFLDVRSGLRLDPDQDEKDAAMAEARWQIDLSKDINWGYIKIKTDLQRVGFTTGSPRPSDQLRTTVQRSPFYYVFTSIYDIRQYHKKFQGHI